MPGGIEAVDAAGRGGEVVPASPCVESHCDNCTGELPVRGRAMPGGIEAVDAAGRGGEVVPASPCVESHRDNCTGELPVRGRAVPGGIEAVDAAGRGGEVVPAGLRVESHRDDPPWRFARRGHFGKKRLTTYAGPGPRRDALKRRQVHATRRSDHWLDGTGNEHPALRLERRPCSGCCRRAAGARTRRCSETGRCYKRYGKNGDRRTASRSAHRSVPIDDDNRLARRAE